MTRTIDYLNEMFAYLAFDEDHPLHRITDEVLNRYGITDEAEYLDDDMLEMAAGGFTDFEDFDDDMLD